MSTKENGQALLGCTEANVDTGTLNGNVNTLAVDIAGAERLTSLSCPTLRLYIRTGRLRVTRCGRRVLIPVEALQELVRDGAPSRMKLTGGKHPHKD